MLTPHLELEHWNVGRRVIGVDEAGRGALAGPVVAAAVVFTVNGIPPGLDDSKRLTASVRRELAGAIQASALAWSVAMVHHQRIDQVNILQATFDAMHQAIDGVVKQLDAERDVELLIDGNRFRPHRLPSSTLVGGDGISPSIAAASILAKTARDTWMEDVDREYPVYGFARHKGYATAVHRDAIRAHGPCEIHRQTFLRTLLSQQPLAFDND